jgi:fumarate hydratase class II
MDIHSIFAVLLNKLQSRNKNSRIMSYRIESDTMGPVNVPADKYWGAQTQRSIQNFTIGGENAKMPIEIIRAFAILKKSAALTNAELGVLSAEKAEIIAKVCDEIFRGKTRRSVSFGGMANRFGYAKQYECK